MDKNIYTSDIMKWDGSDITEYISNVDKFETTFNDIKYLSLKFSDKYVHCILRSCMNSLPAIIDELKPFFGLQKITEHIN